MHKIKLGQVHAPAITKDFSTVDLTDETMQARLDKVVAAMKKQQLDELIVYSDLEHSFNFEYLTGFPTRFEEGLLVVHQTGTVAYILGNENLKMVAHARIKGPVYHYPVFSLPNQPADQSQLSLEDILRECGLTQDSHVGIVGWKLLDRFRLAGAQQFDVPYLIITALGKVVAQANLINATGLFINPTNGVRITNNANEVAHYEFGSSLAAKNVQTTIASFKLGESQLTNSEPLTKYALRTTVVPVCASGERFKNANIAPTSQVFKLGSPVSVTNGYKGGLSSRSGILVHSEDELNPEWYDYVEQVAKPYFNAVVTWLEQIEIGKQGKELWRTINEVLPQAQYHWALNPGHLTADEEWVSSPISKNSEAPIRSGMLFQIDVIPSVPGYPGVGCEDTVLIADDMLQQQIADEYPKLWARFQQRRDYLKSVIGINLSPDILPMSDTVAYYSPYMLSSERILQVKD